ncbi:MAG TPA: DUF1697 domain-containing protein [Symbiobacteriaceae bacterium]|nr:DUF1697 domain-containing protein [Symbiobacteriaceae bacterium]
MTTYIALLRGINVGGHNIIKMADLRTMLERMGLGFVQTYIQSGNVVFQSEEAEEPLRRAMEEEIKRVFGFDVPVALRTAAELRAILARCPYPAENLLPGESLLVSLLAAAPSPEGVDRLGAVSHEPDEFRLLGRELYLLCRQPIHKSKLTNQFFEKKLGVPVTARNWQTMTKLAALADGG